jgi:hypothetical protein
MPNNDYFRFVLDKMAASGFFMPDYINYNKKTADADTAAGSVVGTDADASTVSVFYENKEFPIDSQEKVWLSAVKLACLPDMPKTEQDFYRKQIYAAAERYGIRNDLDKAAEFITNSENEPQTIKTSADWQKAKTWLTKHAASLASELVMKLANYLLDKTAEVGCVPSLSEQYELREMAGRNPMTPELQKFAETNLHRLANGTYYRTDQFASLTYDEVNRCMPDLIKNASLGMPVLNASTFAKAASESSEAHADVIECLLSQHGQYPIHTERGHPVEINDQVLAEL